MHTVCEYKNIVYYFYMDSRREYVRSDVGSSPMRMSIQDVEKLKTKPVQRLVLCRENRKSRRKYSLGICKVSHRKSIGWRWCSKSK